MSYLTNTNTAASRQGILQAAVSSTGSGNFLSSGSGLTVNLAATTTPLVLSFAGGNNNNLNPNNYISTVSADTTSAWAGLAINSTNYLYVDRNTSTGALTYNASVLPPLYQPVAPTPFSLGTQVAPTNMTSNTLPSPYVAASSVSTGAYSVFDGSNTTDFNSGAGNPTCWLSLDYGSGNGKVITAYMIRSSSGNNYFPNTWTFEGSNDNSTWTVLDTRLGQTGWSSGGEPRYFIINNTTNYRYYRVNVSASTGNAVGISTIQMWTGSTGIFPSKVNTTMTSAATGSATVTDTQHVDTSHLGWNAFDVSITEGWVTSSGTTTGTLTYDFGAGNARSLDGYSIQGRTDGVNNNTEPGTWTFDGSNNGSTWTTLDTQTTVPAWSLGERRVYTLSTSSGAYRYYRINITANKGASFLAIADMQLLGNSSSPINDQHWFDSTNMAMKVYNGSTWTTVQRVFVGHALTNATQTTGTVSYTPSFFSVVGGSVSAPGNSSFRANQSTAQSITAITWTKVQFQTLVWDTQNEFDPTTNYRFTAKQAGIYSFQTGVTFLSTASAQSVTAALYVNGLQHTELIIGCSPGSGYWTTGGGSALVKLNAGDYVEVYTYFSSSLSTTIGGAGLTYFSGQKVA